MNLKKKENIKEQFKDKELFQLENEEENNIEENNTEEDNTEENLSQKLTKLEWKTDSNLYDSAIQVKEINIL